MTAQKGYYSYLLRMWQTSDGEECIWSASLEQPGTQERVGFATLEELFQFLRDRAAAQAEPLGGMDEP